MTFYEQAKQARKGKFKYLTVISIIYNYSSGTTCGAVSGINLMVFMFIKQVLLSGRNATSLQFVRDGESFAFCVVPVVVTNVVFCFAGCCHTV